MSQNIDFSKLTKDQLKEQLRARDLKLGGNKPELIARLQAAINGVPEVPVQQSGGLLPPVMPPSVVPGGLPMVVPGALPMVAVTTSKGKGAPKKPAKTPAEVVTAAVKDSGLSVEAALAALLSVYGLSEFHANVVQALGVKASLVPPVSETPTTYEGLKNLKVEDLKKILKARNEKVGGKKEELIHRILNPTPQAPEQPQVQLPPLPSTVVPSLPVVATETNEDDGETTQPSTPVAAALPTVPGLPVVPSLPTVPGLPVTAALPTVPSLPTVPGLPMVGELPTIPGLPTVPAGLPMLSVAGSPKM